MEVKTRHTHAIYILYATVACSLKNHYDLGRNKFLMNNCIVILIPKKKSQSLKPFHSSEVTRLV